MLESLQSFLSSNQLVSGGLVLAGLGIVAMWLRELPVKVFRWAQHFFVTTLAVDSREELMFPALVEYMDSREALRRINNFTVRAVRQQGSSYQSLHDELQQGCKTRAIFSPGERGRTSFAFQNVESYRTADESTVRRARRKMLSGRRGLII